MLSPESLWFLKVGASTRRDVKAIPAEEVDRGGFLFKREHFRFNHAYDCKCLRIEIFTGRHVYNGNVTS